MDPTNVSQEWNFPVGFRLGILGLQALVVKHIGNSTTTQHTHRLPPLLRITFAVRKRLTRCTMPAGVTWHRTLNGPPPRIGQGAFKLPVAVVMRS